MKTSKEVLLKVDRRGKLKTHQIYCFVDLVVYALPLVEETGVMGLPHIQKPSKMRSLHVGWP